MSHHDRQIEAFGQKVWMAADRENFDRDLWMIEHVTGEEWKEDGLGQIKRHTHANMSGCSGGYPRYILLDAQRLGHERFGLLVASLPGIGQFESACRAMNESGAQFSLERADASGQCR